jgi:hypothetical protein
MMSSVLGKKDVFEHYEEMSEAIRDQVHTTTVENAKGQSKENADGGDDESSNNKSHNPPPMKRQKTDVSSLFKTTGEDSDNYDDKIFEGDDDDDDYDGVKDRDEKKIKRTEVNK